MSQWTADGARIYLQIRSTLWIIGLSEIGMSKRTDTIRQTVSAALAKGGADKSTEVTLGSDILQRMDSLGLMIAFADIQDSLGLKFEPEQLMQLFLCQSIDDMVAVIEEILVSRSESGCLRESQAVD
jgi:acyl carrier protein